MARLNKKTKKRIIDVSKIICGIAFLVLVIFLYKIYKTNLVPDKYFMIILCIFGILEVLYAIIVLIPKPKIKLVITLDIFAVIFILLQIFAISRINEVMSYIHNMFSLEYTSDVYYFVANSNSEYEEIDIHSGNEIEDETDNNFNDKTINYYDATINLDSIGKSVSDLNVKFREETDYGTLLNKLLNDKKYVALMHSSSYDALIENNEEYKKNTKVVYVFNVKQKVKKKKKDDSPDVLKEPFIIFLSGIDTRSGEMPERSLSDVNMIVVVNPKTHKVLMINIPRDYYVPITGSNGMRDKLTHAGMIGGIDYSMAAVEDILDIKIDYYVRVNFNAVINLVDAVGGITVNNDVNYSFTCWTDYGCTIYPGDNAVDGRCALAFARERHAYVTGDRHRGENQQQVINVLLKKLTSPGSVLKNYKDILKALEGTFETSFSEDDITSLIKYQLDKMPSWTTESSNLDGSGANKTTYSYPNQELSVMIPDETTVETAKAKINEVLSGK